MNNSSEILTTPRFVITGGPGFGKSSIINELEKLGKECRHEISRSIIKEQLAIEGDVLPWKNLPAFSEVVLSKRLLQYEMCSGNQPVYFDRGVPDILAYLQFDGYVPNDSVLHAISIVKYQPVVFVTPPWKEIYCVDGERIESYEKACLLHEAIEKTYLNLGYSLVHVPCGSISQRVEFILSTSDKQLL
jgi:predicted ATPase